MGPGVPITLDGKDKTLRFGVRNSRLAVSTLQAYMPQGATKLDIGQAGTLLMRGDQDAIVVFAHAGLMHDDERLTQQQVERWLEKHCDAGGELGDFSMPLLEALRLAKQIRFNYKTTVDAGEDGAAPGRPQLVGVETSRE